MVIEKSGPITELYVYLVDPKGNKDEFLLCDEFNYNIDVQRTATLMVPIVHSNHDSELSRLASRVRAQGIAKATGREIRLIKFTKAEVVEIIK